MMSWCDYTVAICTIITTATTVLGAFFVIIQIRNGTKAQQDKKAPLILLEEENNSISQILIKNVGELSANIVKLIANIDYTENGKHEKLCLIQPFIIQSNNSKKLFEFPKLNKIETDKILEVKIKIYYISPLNDRRRKCIGGFIRG